MYTIDYLMQNSHLPGPRGNLTLLYEFAKHADAVTVDACLGYIEPGTANSPEEFVGMCGILGYAALNKGDIRGATGFIRKYASHSSWRIREAVAMAIQELSDTDENTIQCIGPWITGNPLEQRAVVAGLCEPRLLTNETVNREILEIMAQITKGFTHDNRLSDGEKALRKSLGYGWSVIIAASPDAGKRIFETLFDLPGKHIPWIIRENLKKNRLIRLDENWVQECVNRIMATNRR